MNLLSLPDIVGMFVLMGVLGWYRRRQKHEQVDGWLLGLTFILVEMIAASLNQSPGWLSTTARVVALDADLLAALAFGWSERRDWLPADIGLTDLVVSSLPLLLLISIYGFGIEGRRFYLFFALASLVAGLTYPQIFGRKRRGSRLLASLAYLVLWLPMLILAWTGSIGWMAYWGLAFVYLLVASSFRRRSRSDGIGAWLIMVGFGVWACCLLVYPLAGVHSLLDALVNRVGNLQKYLVVVGMLIVSLEDETKRRKEEAMHDSLTGLPNRRLFDDRLAVALERSRRSGLSVAVFAIDLDGFKEINDRHGHHAGDLVLSAVASQLKHKIRGADTVARCGGDEFLVIINDLARLENCLRIAAGLHAAIASVIVPGTEIKAAGSIGYAVFPEEARSVIDLCQLADERMYKEKNEPMARPR